MRRSTMLRLTVALTSSAVLAACGGGGGGEPRDDAVGTTTTTVATTSTTLGDVAPLTGEPQPDAARRGRVALVVKIDNAPKARPQGGLNQADVVVEEKVEDGVTRLFAVFQNTDAGSIGPVRSARSTDLALAAALRRPLFSYSGANAKFQELVNKAPLVDIGFDKQRSIYVRQKGRPQLYSVFSSSEKMFSLAPPGLEPPPPWFRFRAAGQAVDAKGAADASGVHIEYPGKNVTTVVDWAWDAGSGTWKRTQDGTPHVDDAGVQVAPKNVVVQFVEYIDTGLRDQSNTAVPEGKLVGSGEAWILTDGKVVKATWSKASAEAVTEYKDADGKPVGLTPGRTWVELPPPDTARLT